MERHGASHRVTQTLPGAVNNDPVRTTRLLKSAVTRTRNRSDAIDTEYGARDIPETHPLYAKARQARDAHRAAVTAYGEHVRGQ